MNKFVNAVKTRDAHLTQTENFEYALDTTNSKVLDLFAKAGSLRNTDVKIKLDMFKKAYIENDLLTRKLIFHTRNIRGGLGERETFRLFLKELSSLDIDKARVNLHLVPEFGRWDDLLIFIDTNLEKDVIKLFADQLHQDIKDMKEDKPVSLAAKWVVKPNARNKSKRKFAEKLAKQMGYTNHELQKKISTLREYLDIVERKITEKDYENIDFEALPSYAMNKYNPLFKRKGVENFILYLESLEKGEAKINSSVMYPSDIVKTYMDRLNQYDIWYDSPYICGDNIEVDPIVEAQWKALPDYVGDVKGLVVADTSGSMYGTPIHVALSLAVYFAERNKGVFKDLAITFSKEAKYIHLEGETLAEKLGGIDAIVENTNIESVFNLILDTSKRNEVTQEDMPEVLVIITDGQFDNMVDTEGSKRTMYEKTVEKFEESGYKVPTIVFWNVDTRNNGTFEVSADMPNTILVSGYSPSVFENLEKYLKSTPYDVMLEILNSEKYAEVK